MYRNYTANNAGKGNYRNSRHDGTDIFKDFSFAEQYVAKRTDSYRNKGYNDKKIHH